MNFATLVQLGIVRWRAPRERPEWNSNVGGGGEIRRIINSGRGYIDVRESESRIESTVEEIAPETPGGEDDRNRHLAETRKWIKNSTHTAIDYIFLQINSLEKLFLQNILFLFLINKIILIIYKIYAIILIVLSKCFFISYI